VVLSGEGDLRAFLFFRRFPIAFQLLWKIFDLAKRGCRVSATKTKAPTFNERNARSSLGESGRFCFSVTIYPFRATLPTSPVPFTKASFRFKKNASSGLKKLFG
jgi:hypothetical protein